MKKILLTLTLLILLVFTAACNANKTRSISNDAIQQANAFPQASRNPDEVVCVNCHAKFKASSAKHKITNGHEYIECPVCHHNYLKKGN